MAKARTTAKIALTAAAILVGLSGTVSARTASTGLAADEVSQGGAASKCPAPRKHCIVAQFTGPGMGKKICKTRQEWEAKGLNLEMK